MKVIAFTHKVVDAEQIETTKRWLQVAADDIPIYNIPSYRVEDLLKSGMAVITFGKIAGLSVQQYIKDKKLVNVTHLELPALRNLERREENRSSRSATQKQLEDLKKVLEEDRYFPQEIVVHPEDLPELDRRQIILLEKFTEESGKSSCFQMTVSGKLVEISTKPQPNSKADVHLTFQELLALRLALDVLGTKEVRLVSISQEPPGNTSNRSNKSGN